MGVAGHQVAAERDAINRLREKRAEIELYMQSRSDAIRDLEKRKREEIMNDIFAEIRRRALAEGYDFGSSPPVKCSTRSITAKMPV